MTKAMLYQFMGLIIMTVATETAVGDVPYPRSIPLPPGCPEPTYERLQVAGRDGLKLVGHEWTPPKGSDGNPVALFIHGIGMHGEPYAAVANGFTSKGVTLIVPDIRGHGRSEGTKGELASRDVLCTDIDCWIDLINKRHPKSPVVLLGDSMGGLIAGEYARTGQKRLAGLILIVPAFGINLSQLRVPTDVPHFFSTGLIKIDTTANLNASTREPGFVKAKQADPLATHDVYPGYLVAIARMSLSWPLAGGEFKLPVFLCLAEKDQVVDNTLAQRVLVRAETPKDKKRVHVWKEACHTVCWDPIAVAMVEEMTAWMLTIAK